MLSLERSQFFDDLLITFSQVIPIPLERLRTSKRFQYDGTRPDLPILIEIRLIATRNKEDMKTEQILNDINTLVFNKFVTPLIDFTNTTALLDPEYGVIETSECFIYYFFFFFKKKK